MLVALYDLIIELCGRKFISVCETNSTDCEIIRLSCPANQRIKPQNQTCIDIAGD